MNKITYSRAPVRICDIGGWTDTWFYPDGAVLNFCINLYNYVIIKQSQTNDIRIYSENLRKGVKMNSYENIKFNGELDLLKAVIKKLKIKSGIDINIRSEIPPGSGMGTSASVCVALVAALLEYLDKQIDPIEIAQIAHEVEVKELKMQSGIQDQYASALGGVNLFEISYPTAKTKKVVIDEKKKFELENSMILILLGSRSSDKMHNAIIEKYLNGDQNIQKCLDGLKNCAYKMFNAINKDITQIGEIMNENWELQKKLHPLMVNEAILNAEKIANKYESLGFKCNGAGGGGSAVILAKLENIHKLKIELIEKKYKILPSKLNFGGVFAYVE